MTDILVHMNFHYSARDRSEAETRELVEEALNVACVHLEKLKCSEYIGFKIREISSLDE